MFEKIPGKFQEDFWRESIRFWVMFGKTPGHGLEDSRKCLRKFPGNV